MYCQISNMNTRLLSIVLFFTMLCVNIMGREKLIYAEEIPYTYNAEEKNDLEILSNVPITISSSTKSRFIPSSTQLLTDGVVKDGQPTYEVNVQYQFKAVASFGGAATFEIVSGSIVSDGTATSGTVSPVAGTACGLSPAYSSSEGCYVYTYTITYNLY